MAMTKSQVQSALAGKLGMPKKQVVHFFEELAALACREAKNTCVVPGIGKLVLVQRAARIGRNPMTGAQIQIPAKQALKFRVAKAAREAILGCPQSDSKAGKLP